jgi:FKBP-type peptidyl-prolyl cis-trans isomerase
MLPRILISFMGCAMSLCASAQYANPQSQPRPVQVTPTQPQQQPVFNFKRINPNLEYAYIINRPGPAQLKEGDQISVNMQMIGNDRLLFSSWQTYKGKPVVYGVTKPSFKGDVIEGMMLMSVGDSMVFRVDGDALFKNTKNKRPDFLKPGDKIYYFTKLVSVKTKEQQQKEQQDAINKQINDQMAKARVAAEKQVGADDKMLSTYFTTKNLSPIKTSAGLYYKINEEGTGEMAKAGDTVTMNYSGTLLDGTKFDSNEDTTFGHVQPYTFVLGRGVVVRGWDEGIALLKVGSKATFYIPSGMAYGTMARPANPGNPKGIPANSILIFDVQLMAATHPK